MQGASEEVERVPHSLLDLYSEGAQLVRAGVERAAEFYFRQGIADATAKRYEGVWRRYAGLCASIREESLSVSEEKAIAYIVTLAGEGLQPAMLKYHLAGLRQAQIRTGYPAPDWGRFAWVSPGIEQYKE